MQGYYPFSNEITGIVSAVAERQTSMSYQDFMKEVGFNGVITPEPAEGFTPTSIVDIRPREHDPKAAIMVHLAMANPLDPNQLMQIATIAAANPNSRVIASGNPSGKGYGTGLLHGKQLWQVARGDYRPTVEPLVRYAEQQGIEEAAQVGFSFGVEKGHTAAAFDAFKTTHDVAIEPVPIVRRPVLWLATKFMLTGGPLEEYVNANGNPAFREARNDSVTMTQYISGLGRLTNIAIAEGMTHATSMKRWAKAIEQNPDMISTFAWGSDSELAKDNQMFNNVMHARAGQENVHHIRIEGGKHNMVNDLALQSAIIKTGLR